MQFGQLNSTKPITLYHLPVLDPVDKSFDFFALLVLYDWIIENSEVESFQGDNGNLTLLSNSMNPRQQTVDSAQLSTVFALFAQKRSPICDFCHDRDCLQNIFVHTFLPWICGRIKHVELNRVGGIIWVGRPLILLRSLTAL
ncbi:hypothetical protein THRCLA_02919 [Thraustotheca clavata]|uniref:Uncharacterized protein n=1 Tax=Thraustotheca clavata TaxID=74557 RepID=A0A1W0A3M0_9STRA|nr:hypothetical protein THRCLA_02919 [Thraustotheca clavata]